MPIIDVGSLLFLFLIGWVTIIIALYSIYRVIRRLEESIEEIEKKLHHEPRQS